MSDLDRYFYQQEQPCPVCGQKFPVTKVRKSMLTVDQRDTDLYNHCSPVDPNFYTVIACPHCGYAASDAHFGQVTPQEKPLITQALAGRGTPPDLTGERDSDRALQAMEQALFCAQARHAKPSVLAGLYLKAAWVLRAARDPREPAYLVQALENYRQAYQSETLPLGKMSELTLTYLIGELARRTGNLNEAVNWFYQVVNSPEASQEPQILNQAREQWRSTREQAEAVASGKTPAPTPVTADLAALSAAAPSASQPASPPAPAEETAPPASVETAPPASVKTEPPGPPAAGAAETAEDAEPAAPAVRSKVPTALSLYRDQVDWARRVANLCAGINPRLDLAAVVRSTLQLVQDLDPTDLEAEDEETLTSKLRQKLGLG